MYPNYNKHQYNQDLFKLTCEAFDIADMYRVPVLILADGALGQMMEPVVFPDKGEVKLPEKPWATTGTGMKRKKNIINSLFLQPEELEKLVEERYQRYAEMEKNEVLVETVDVDDADIIVTAYGTTARIVKNAKEICAERGIKVGIIRPITLWPFPTDTFAKAAERGVPFLSVEMSMGQMVEDVKLAVNGKAPVHFYGRTGGMVPSPVDIADKIAEITGGAK